LLTKISLDQLLSILSELDKKDIYNLQEIGKEVIADSELSPGIKAAVKAIFCVGVATALAVAKERDDE
jgi:hypothetical protein